jgi:hypothetical protein
VPSEALTEKRLQVALRMPPVRSQRAALDPVFP